MGVAALMGGYYDEKDGTLKLYELIGNGAGMRSGLSSERDFSREQRTELVFGLKGKC